MTGQARGSCRGARRYGARSRAAEKQGAEAEAECVEPAQPEPQSRLGGHAVQPSCAAAPLERRRHQEHGQDSAQPEGETDQQSQAGRAHAQADGCQRPYGEGEHEGGESEPEQDAVQATCQGQTHRPPPSLGNLPAYLRCDPHATPVGDRCRQSQAGAERLAQATGLVSEQSAHYAQPAERDRSPDQRAEGERRARDECGGPARVAERGSDRVHHREAAW